MIYEHFTKDIEKLRQWYRNDEENLNKISSWEADMNKIQTAQDFFNNDICKGILKNLNRKFVNINKLLFLDESLTPEKRERLYGKREEISSMIKLFTRDQETYIKQIEEFVKNEIETIE